MLFEFNRFWKSILVLVGTWALYGLTGYEFTMVTLLATLLATKLNDTSHII